MKKCDECKKIIPKGKEINQKEETYQLKHEDQERIYRKGGIFCKKCWKKQEKSLWFSFLVSVVLILSLLGILFLIRWFIDNKS